MRIADSFRKPRFQIPLRRSAETIIVGVAGIEPVGADDSTKRTSP
jgi:hypothetical protein